MEIKVYVGGLSYDTTEDGLSALFAQAGTVKSVHIATDRDTGRSRGFGFVEQVFCAAHALASSAHLSFDCAPRGADRFRGRPHRMEEQEGH